MTSLTDEGKNKQLMILVDGNAIVHRAYHAMKDRPLSVSKTGEVTMAVFGFMRMLLKVLKEYKPQYCLVAFDTPKPTFRHLSFEDYKKHRKPTPEDLKPQFIRVKQLLQAMKIVFLEKEGYEADDILGTLAERLKIEGIEGIIVSGDNDELQLVSPGIGVLLPQKTFSDTVLYDEAAVLQKYGIQASQLPDYKGLIGDASDNIPGIPGIGEKTAQKLLQQYPSLEDVYANIEVIKPEKIRETLRANKDIALRAKGLTTIVTDFPVEFDIEACRLGKLETSDKQQVLNLLRELEFYKLIGQLKSMEHIFLADTGSISERQDIEISDITRKLTAVQDLRQLEEAASGLVSEKAIFIEAAGDTRSGLSAIGIATFNGGFYFHIRNRDLLATEGLEEGTVLSKLKGLLESETIKKIGHNLKRSYVLLTSRGISLKNLHFDTAIASYLLGERPNLGTLVISKLGKELQIPESIKVNTSGELNDSKASINELVIYMGEVLSSEIELYPVLEEELSKKDLLKLFREIEMPLIEVLAKMEMNGICIDAGILRAMSRRLAEKLSGLENEIYRMAAGSFNINSSKQLGVVLFEKLKMPVSKKTKTGYSTDASTLNELRGRDPIINHILEYRQLTKLKSTYVDPLPLLVNPETGRLHTIFNQTVTATGRLSSSEPNLQNIPIRGELGKEIRRTFVSPSGSYLLRGDYSQIDLRVLAHMSSDKALVDAFRRDEDIHSVTAARVYGIDLNKVSYDMRRVGKTVNFGVIYGMSDYGLEQATELSREDAARFITTYFEQYPDVSSYIERTKQEARELGYVQTLFGRRRYIPDINSQNYQLRSTAERMAINMPIQGTAADIIKIAMIRLSGEMKRLQLRSRMLLQIHDELLFEVPESEINEMRILVSSIMSSVVELKVPLKVDIGAGRNWAEME